MPTVNIPDGARYLIRQLAEDWENGRRSRRIVAGRIIPGCAGVFSLDIDDTIDLDDGYPAPVRPEDIGVLMAHGYIVGTASDRLPSEQRQVMSELGWSDLAFAVPKELLYDVRIIVPAPRHIHAGDSPERDRKPALDQGWEYLTHHEAADFIKALSASSRRNC